MQSVYGEIDSPDRSPVVSPAKLERRKSAQPKEKFVLREVKLDYEQIIAKKQDDLNSNNELAKMARISDGLYLLLEALRWMRCDSWRIKPSQIPSIKPLEEGNSKVPFLHNELSQKA